MVFFVKQLDHNQNAKLNVSKPRDDSIPYPDNLAPFHVPAKSPGACKIDPVIVSILKNHCVYSLGVLLLMLLEEKYCRPAYAKTENVKEVYAAIAEGKDCKYLEYVIENTRKDPEGRYSGGKKEALKTVLSTFHAQQQPEGFLLSWMDSFKLQVTEVQSCYELIETRC